MAQALGRVVAVEREEVAEQQRPGHVDREGRPGPLPGLGRRRLGQADPDQRPDHAAERRSPPACAGRAAASASGSIEIAADGRDPPIAREIAHRPLRWGLGGGFERRSGGGTGAGRVPGAGRAPGTARTRRVAGGRGGDRRPGRARDALAAIDAKGLNVEATAVFATWRRAVTRAGAIRAMVALQVAVDCLDTLGERDAGGRRRLPRPALRRLPRERPGAARTRRRRRRRSSAPSPAAAKARRRPTWPSAATAPRSRPGPARSGAPPGYRWWEVAAGASSSVAAHALIAAAADPRTSRRRGGADRRRLLPPDRRPHRPPRRPDRPRGGRGGRRPQLPGLLPRRRGGGGPPRPDRPPRPRPPRRAAPPPPPRRDPRRRRRLLPQRRGGRDALRAPGPRAPAALDRARGAADRRLHAPAPRALAELRRAQTARKRRERLRAMTFAHMDRGRPGKSGTVRAWYQGPRPRSKRALPAGRGDKNKNIDGPSCQPDRPLRLPTRSPSAAPRKAQVGEQCQQHQLGPQFRQAVDAADADVVADQADDPRHQGLVGRGRQSRVPWRLDLDEAGEAADNPLVSPHAVGFRGARRSSAPGPRSGWRSRNRPRRRSPPRSAPATPPRPRRRREQPSPGRPAPQGTAPVRRLAGRWPPPFVSPFAPVDIPVPTLG